MKNTSELILGPRFAARKILARCAVVGTLVGLLATQNFAQNAPDANVASLRSSTAVTEPSIASATSATLSVHFVTGATNLPEPAPVALAAIPPSRPAIQLSRLKLAAVQDSQTQPSAPPKKHIRPGFLILGIAGSVVATIGVIGYAEHSPRAGTIFFVPGAIMTGTGFYFTWRH